MIDGLRPLAGLSANAQLPNSMGITTEACMLFSNDSTDPGEQVVMDIIILTTRLLRGLFLAVIKLGEGT